MQLLASFRVLPALFGYYQHDSGTTRIIGTNVGLQVVRVRVKPAGTRKKNPLPITT